MNTDSSKSKEAQTLAESDMLTALTELANLRDDPADFERFEKRRPGFAHVPQQDSAGMGPIGGAAIPNRFWSLHKRMDALRLVWRGDSLALSELLLPNEPPEELMSREEYLDRDEETGRPTGWVWPPQIRMDWESGQFTYDPRTKFQQALYLLFRRSQLAKICENPNCPAPYFIARKTAQRYCTDKCAEIFQRAWKRKWWAEHGEKWRSSRKRSRKRATRKRATRKGSTTPAIQGPAS